MCYIKILSLRIYHRDFPGGPVVKNLPSNAGDVGLILDQGTKIPWGNWTHMPLLKKQCACATTAEPTCSGARAPSLEKPVHCNEKTAFLSEDPPQLNTHTHTHTHTHIYNRGLNDIWEIQLAIVIYLKVLTFIHF